MTKSSHQIEKLSKFLAYVLGRRPDEFGLVTDEEGYVSIKELLQALHEEPGWRHIRMGHINEVSITLTDPAIQIEGNRIRAADMSQLPVASRSAVLPKLLYTAIRPRAYPIALDNGLIPSRQPYLVLAKDADMAMRMGRRHDNNPTLLTVQVAESTKRGTSYSQYGSELFLSNSISAGTFKGPALPKEKQAGPMTPKPVQAQHPRTPGSYFPSFDATSESKSSKGPDKRRKEPEWQKSRRQARRHKAKLNK